MGGLSLRKGKAFEREVAQLFRAAGIPAERNLEEVRSGNLEDFMELIGLLRVSGVWS